MLIRCLLFICGVVLVSAKLPDYIKVCKSTEPNLPACITNSVNALKPYLKVGIPELEVPPIDPLFLDEIKLRSGPRAAKLDANITNVKVWGPSEFQVLEVRPNVAKKKFAFKATIPQIYFEGDYDIDMNILLLKYKGVGPIFGNFKTQIQGGLQFKEVSRNNYKYGPKSLYNARTIDILNSLDTAYESISEESNGDNEPSERSEREMKLERADHRQADYTFDCILKGHTTTIKGDDYLEFEKMRCKISFGNKSTIKLGNLFKDDPVIAKATDGVIEENTDVFLREIKPILEDSLSTKFTDIANKLTLKFTYKELFP